MVLKEGPPTQRHEVQILTTGFQFSGQLETVGPAFRYVSDPGHESLSLYDTQMTPLTPGSPLKGLSRPHIVIRKPQIVFIYFNSAETRASIRPLVKKDLLVGYTKVAVCRGYFHMPAEARMRDFLAVLPSDLVIVTEARLFPLIELPAPFPVETELLLANRAHLLHYHPS